MRKMLELIKQTGVGAVDATKPVTVLYGTVVKINPLEVSLDQQSEPLTEDFLLVPEQMTSYEVNLRHTHESIGSVTEEALIKPILIRKGLEVGDMLLLLRVQGGLQFVILDRLVKP
ncbi:DUF2577 domain-containing protein [Paenibacillus vulneris]|uniref:DUF2577 domain-containing protein n=1 Tax=Paenibacillus vulneris TaxID=1133364 RepID=A0ABW3UXV9_9BACL